MWRDRIAKAQQRLIGAGNAAPEGCVGCSTSEIDRLERECGLALPAAYRFFLQEMGKNAGTFLRGTEWTFDTLPDLQQVGRRLLRERNSESLMPAPAFVFAAHQRYQFLYFDCTEGDDPPVYHCMEGAPNVPKVYDQFSQWVLRTVVEESQLRR
jgi:SMI1-KNR4 cell-wall